MAKKKAKPISARKKPAPGAKTVKIRPVEDTDVGWDDEAPAEPVVAEEEEEELEQEPSGDEEEREKEF